ncbi:caspase-7-like isoform X2 [Alosa alosa]|uniref:caspase-7-like isoform X2 n=1 Tax=Alosa alosa TaxID=278164 RepID=UPI002015546E|nr:caspase-7-like isoform X2 [Alosa alosa]
MSFCNKAHGSSKVCNRAVVVSIKNFHRGVELEKRCGVSMDNLWLNRCLSDLGFTVEMHNDLTAQEIYKLFKAESKKTVDCFIGIISTHGEEGVVFGSDGNHACRGDMLDSGVEIEMDSGSVSDEDDILSDYLSIPINTAVMYATAPGYSAFKKPSGSVFIQTLCDLLEKDGGRDLEITRLMTRLNYQIAYHFQASGGDLEGKKAMPCFATRLTEEVYPFRDSQRSTEELSGKLATTALVEGSCKIRKRSIS